MGSFVIRYQTPHQTLAIDPFETTCVPWPENAKQTDLSRQDFILRLQEQNANYLGFTEPGLQEHLHDFMFLHYGKKPQLLRPQWFWPRLPASSFVAGQKLRQLLSGRNTSRLLFIDDEDTSYFLRDTRCEVTRVSLSSLNLNQMYDVVVLPTMSRKLLLVTLKTILSHLEVQGHVVLRVSSWFRGSTERLLGDLKIHPADRLSRFDYALLLHLFVVDDPGDMIIITCEQLRAIESVLSIEPVIDDPAFLRLDVDGVRLSVDPYKTITRFFDLVSLIWGESALGQQIHWDQGKPSLTYFWCSNSGQSMAGELHLQTELFRPHLLVTLTPFNYAFLHDVLIAIHLVFAEDTTRLRAQSPENQLLL